jgi:ATP-dependent exoDNAse (exonuclease V) beta subunit
MRLADQAARDRIRGDLNATVIVEAAAGTGKTTELIERIVALVKRGHTTLDRILAVTFTELAAGEMKLRLRTELEKVRQDAPAQEHDRLTAALAKLEVAPIGTIHSFCADLLREWPVEAGVDPVFEIAADESRDRLFGQAFDAWFQRVLGNPPEGVRRLLRRRARGNDFTPREQLRRAGLDLLERRDFDASWSRPPFDRSAGLARTLERLSELADLAPRAQRPDDKLAQALSEVARWLADLRRREGVRGRDEDGLEAELCELSHRFYIWKSKGYGKWFADGLERKSVGELRDRVKADLDAFLEKCDSDIAAALREELRPLCAAYEALKAQSGCLDFLDLLLRARDLVRGDRAVRQELQQRFTHILVDEFQDTDPLQAEILVLLAADDPTQEDWRRARALPGKLFLVGDPKQSIYRFRRADIALYEEVKGVLLSRGAEVVHLTTSFRSVPGIQEAVNAAFAPRMGGGTQATYVPLDRFRPAPEGKPQVIALPAPRLYNDRGWIVHERIEESYADAVAAFIDFLTRKSGWTVTEREDQTRQVPLGARHVCLLFRRMRSWNGDVTRPYVRALEARRIPHVLVGGRSYHSREEVLAIRNAAQAIEWPDDELSVFATLRGPLFALGDDALLLFHQRQGRLHPLRRLDVPTMSPQEREVARALEVLRGLHLGRNRRPIAQTLTMLLQATRAHAGIAIWPTGEQALANVLRVLELARRFEAAGASSFRAFAEQLAEDAERDDAAEAPVVEEGTEGVRVMTVHRAKGLEFPVVILCDPTAPVVPRNPSRFIDPERRLWAMPLAGCVPADLLQNRQAALDRDREEILRVAYVAATRARDLLVVPAQGDGQPQGWLEALNPVIYPLPFQRQQPQPAPGCPEFQSKDTVHDRPEDSREPVPVSPGLHAPQVGSHEVVWWDPSALKLNVETAGGLREQDVLVEDEQSRDAAQATARAHDEWQARRAQVLKSGAEPSMRVTTVTALAAGEGGAAYEPVEYVSVDVRQTKRPRGKRFGTLVHAVLAEVDLHAIVEGTATGGVGGAVPDAIRRVAAAHGRLVGATDEEVQAAAEAASMALEHPLLRRAVQSGDCRRDTAVMTRLPDGTMMEGIVDLAFREELQTGAVWTVVDFKTDARIEDQPQYAAQLHLYCSAISTATGEATHPILLSL